MKITREMYAGASDVYTDLMAILIRQTGSMWDYRLEAGIEFWMGTGMSFNEAVLHIRMHFLEPRVETLLKGGSHG